MSIDVEGLAEDLKILAKHRDGFDRPEPLAKTLKYVLDLSCVKTSAAPHEKSLVARVLALRSVLAVVTDRIENAETSDAAKVLMFVEGGGIENEEPLCALNHESRRELIEESQGKKADTFRTRSEPHVIAVIAGELALYESETKKSGPVPTIPHTTKVTHDVAASRQTILNTLRNHFPEQLDVYPLASMILGGRPTLTDVEVSIVLEDDTEQPDHFYCETKMDFRISTDEFLVAAAPRPGLCELVLAECPRVADVYGCTNERERDELVKTLTTDVNSLILVETTGEGHRKERVLKFVSVADSEEREQYIGNISDQYRESIALVKAILPENLRQPLHLRSIKRSRHERNNHFCFWEADRPTFVKSITIDAENFSGSEERDRVITVQPFMLASVSEALLSDKSVRTLPVDNWLVRGQGISVIW